MLKMFRGRENGSRGGACRDTAQISRHLEEADTEALLDELMELTEAAANGDVDLEKIDAYLNALDEKDPLPFEIDTEAALTDFHNKHGLLIKESRATHRRHLKTKRTASKIAAAIAIVCDKLAGCGGVRDRCIWHDRAMDERSISFWTERNAVCRGG